MSLSQKKKKKKKSNFMWVGALGNHHSWMDQNEAWHDYKFILVYVFTIKNDNWFSLSKNYNWFTFPK